MFLMLIVENFIVIMFISGVEVMLQQLFFYGRPTYNNNKCADDDIAASNELLEIIGVDLDKGTKANKTGTS